MSRPARILLISAGSLIALLAIAVVAVISIGNSDWLREKFRQRIVAEASAATGGRMEIGAFKLDWRTLTAELDNVVLHGKEPAGTVPFLTIKRLVIGFRVLSLAEKTFDVARLEAENPQAHVIIQADGSTNVPEPPPPHHDIPKLIMDLRIGKFGVTDGVVMAEQAGSKSITAWNARGENLASQASYNRPNKRYDGEVSIAAVNLAWGGLGKITGQFTARASMEVNRVTVSSAALKTGDSEIDVSDVVVSSFTAPVTTGQYKARVSLRDADRIFKLVDFQHTGTVTATGSIRYVSSKDYSVSGAVRGVGIGYGKIPDIRVTGNVSATPDKVQVNALRLTALGGEIVASGTVRKFEDVHLSGEIQHFDAAALAGVADITPLPWDGLVSGPFDLAGKLSESEFHKLVASATLAVSPAERGEPVRGEVSVKYDEPAGTIEFGHSWLELPKTRLDVTGVLGQRLDVKLQTQNLGELKPLLGSVSLPFRLENGSIDANGSVTGALENPRIAGHAAIQNAIYLFAGGGQHIDSLAGDFTAAKTSASVANAALVSGNLRARVTGSIGLTEWKVTDASAVNGNVQFTNADVPQLLALAGEKDFPATGTLNTTAQVTGTVGDPRISADLRLTKGQLYGEPYDLVTGRAQYVNGGQQLVTAVLDAGRKRVNVTARYDHAPNTFTAGKLTFNVSSNAMALSQIAVVKQREPEISGTVQIKADGAVEIKSTGVDVMDLNGDLTATGLMLGVRNFGDAHFTAQTKNDVMTVRFDSNAAKATIRGEGTVRLGGDYPVDAKLTFGNVGLNAFAAALMPENKQQNFDGSVAGDVTLRGPAKTPDLITATFEIPQFELHPLAVTGDAKNIPNLALKNMGPIRATLERSAIRFDSAHFQAPSTDLDLSGTVSLKDASPLNLRVKGSVNLALAETVSPDLSSAGELAINAAVRGSYTTPDLSGTAELQKGTFHYAEFSNGLTNASAVIAFNGTRATIQSFRGESGGGKVDATGFAALTGGLIAFRLEAKTREVRVRYPEGVSTVSDADLTMSGTSQRSQVSGTVTIRRIAINPRSDIETILASAALPAKTPEAGTGGGVLGNMNLDVQIETAPDVAFQTSVAQSIEADANLRLRGTPINPAVLGRINVTQGQLVFLGNKYTINQGSVSFFNPAKIDPVLNVDLETKARGVDVTLTVNGPLNKLNMSARSDPPLQWADILALLVTGRTPSDPALAIRNTGQSSSLQQMGAQTLLGEAISNPVGGNLQRFFGVSRIKIDPQLVGITGSPEARLTIEQQVTPDLLFTYISDVSSTSTQLIQVQWDFNRKWSAILTREENGYVGVDFAYKKRFK